MQGPSVPDRSRPPIRPYGRRGIILRSTAQDFRTLEDVARAVSRAFGASDDAALDYLRTRKALKDLQRAKLVARTPFGWRCTAQCQQLLDAVAPPG